MGRRDAVQFTLEVVARARALGATVTFEPGWETRGNGTTANYEGAIIHHTASQSSAANPNPTRSVLINGRPDLTGPLCNFTGPWCAADAPWLHVIAANPANHAGASGGRSMGPLPVTSLFNPRVVGLEIDYAGSSPMADGQRRAALIFARAVCDVLGRSTDYVRGHAETSITGKWDPGYATGKTIDLDAFRRDAATLTPSSSGGFLMALSDAQQTELLSAMRDVRSWLRGGDPNVDNITLLWLGNNANGQRLDDLKALLVGATPDDGDRLSDIWTLLLAIQKAVEAKAPSGAAVPTLDVAAIADAVAEKVWAPVRDAA